MEHYTDVRLLELFHDETTKHYAFNLLIRKYQSKVYWVVRRMLINHDDTNDAVQNIFIKIWKNLDRFENKSGLYTWIYRIAINESITFLNKKRKLFFIPLHDVENELSNQLEADAFFSGDEIQKKLQKAILTLPERQRLVFNMKYFDELKYEEIAEILNVTVGTLKSTFFIASNKIEEYLKNH